MLLIPRRLSKLAVSAYLVCVLLMVIICGTRVLCVKLYNDCSKENIAIDRKGRVYAWNKHKADYQNLTITSRDFTGKLSIFAEKSRRYLCFNIHWKLVGLKKHRGNRCLFYEEMLENGYTRYRSVADETRYAGFTKKGLRMNVTKLTNLTPRMQKCLYFLKLDSKFNISEHNIIIGRTNVSDMIRHRQIQSSSSLTTIVDNQNNGDDNNKRRHHRNQSALNYSSKPSEYRQLPIRIRHRNHHQTSAQHLNDIT